MTALSTLSKGKRKNSEAKNLKIQSNKDGKQKTAKEIMKKEGKLHPDEYFKHQICSDMNIKKDWLEETNAKVRFRLQYIEEIRNSEKDSLRATKILHDYLKVKQRDNFLGRGLEKDIKEMEQITSKEIQFKTLPLQRQLSPKYQQNVMVHRVSLKKKDTVNLKAGLLSPQARKKPIKIVLSQQEKDNQKLLNSMAEDLQREILEMEHGVGKEEKNIASTCPNPVLSNQRRSSKFGSIVHHQSLAEDAIIWSKIKAEGKSSTKTAPPMRVRRCASSLGK